MSITIFVTPIITFAYTNGFWPQAQVRLKMVKRYVVNTASAGRILEYKSSCWNDCDRESGRDERIWRITVIPCRSKGIEQGGKG